MLANARQGASGRAVAPCGYRTVVKERVATRNIEGSGINEAREATARYSRSSTLSRSRRATKGRSNREPSQKRRGIPEGVRRSEPAASRSSGQSGPRSVDTSSIATTDEHARRAGRSGSKSRFRRCRRRHVQPRPGGCMHARTSRRSTQRNGPPMLVAVALCRCGAAMLRNFVKGGTYLLTTPVRAPMKQGRRFVAERVRMDHLGRQVLILPVE